jgi:hypothetical protein
MITSSLSATASTNGVTPWLSRALLTVYLASLVTVCGLLVIYGPQIRAAVEAEKARANGEDDRAFCTKFGIGPETTRYEECAAALRDVRSRHDQRSADLFF